MATQTILGGVALPPLPAQGAVAITLTQVSSLTSENSLAAFVVQAPKTGNIRKVRWGTRAVTTGGDMDVRIETVDATTGHPSGTLWGTNTNGTQTVANGDDNAWFTTTLTADAAVTKGDLIAVCVKTPAGTNLNVLSALNLSSINSTFPYFRFFNAGIATWAGTGSGSPMLMLEYSDGSYAPIRGCYPAGDVTSHTQSTATTPDVVGVRFQLPFPCRVSGLWASIDGDGDCAIRLVTTAYHQANATGILASYQLDKDTRTSTAQGVYQIELASPVSLSAGTWYRLIVEPTSATSITGPHDIAVPSAAGLDSWYVGQNWHLTTAKDPTADGSWTNYNSGTFRTVPLLGLIIDGFDNAVSAGGVSRNRFQRGM